MTRKLRHLNEADWHHVYNQGADRQDIFSLGGDRELFEALIEQASKATGTEVHAYALMTNHFHLLVFDPDGDLPEFMRLLCARYAQAYNDRTGRSGPLFTGRYGSTPIIDDQHLLTAARYVERNPLDFVPAGSLAAYRHSSLGVYLGVRPAPAWLRTGVLLAMMEGSTYLDFVLEPHEADLRLPFRASGSDQSTLFDFWHSAHLASDVDVRTSAGPVRNVALAVALELRLADSSQLAKTLGITAGGVRMAARRGRVLVDTDDAMADLRGRILAALSAAAA